MYKDSKDIEKLQYKINVKNYGTYLKNDATDSKLK